MTAPGNTPISSKEDGWAQKTLHLELASEVTVTVTEQRLSFTSIAVKTLFRSRTTGHWEIGCLELPRQ